MNARDRLIVALDLPSGEEAAAMVARLSPAVDIYKVGFQLLLTAGGIKLVESLVGEGKQVFLDAKVLDIDNTAAAAVRSAEKLGVHFLTVHAYPKAMRAAVGAIEMRNVALIAVLVLSSMNDYDLEQAGYHRTLSSLVRHRLEQASEYGMDGAIIAAPELRDFDVAGIAGNNFLRIVPGIRRGGDAKHDQKRTGTPAGAIAAGADYLVVGRPIIEAPDPLAAAEGIIDDIAAAL